MTNSEALLVLGVDRNVLAHHIAGFLQVVEERNGDKLYSSSGDWALR